MGSYYDCFSNYDLKYGYEKEYFWISGVCLVVVGIFGFVGNIITCITLLSGNLRRNSFYQLLIVLSIFDICFILSLGIRDGYQALACEPHNENVSHLTYIALDVSLTGSIYITVAISLERYFGICFTKKKIKCGVWIYVIPVLIIDILYNFPRIFERNYFIVNGTLESNRREFSNRESYKYGYYFVASTVINSLIPMISLLYLNSSIILTIKRTSKNLRALGESSQENQRNKTNILFAVVIIFFICHFPRVIYKSLYYFGSSADEFREKWWFIVPVKKLALMLNSSINFVIYCLLGQTFRKELLCFLASLKRAMKYNFL